MSKIRELAIKAGMISSEYNGFDRCNLDAAEQEFARLLIEEACRAMNPMLRDMISRGEAVELIKKQFNESTIDNIKAGAEVNSGDGGYGIGTMEAYEEFVKKRNESLKHE